MVRVVSKRKGIVKPAGILSEVMIEEIKESMPANTVNIMQKIFNNHNPVIITFFLPCLDAISIKINPIIENNRILTSIASRAIKSP